MPWLRWTFRNYQWSASTVAKNHKLKKSFDFSKNLRRIPTLPTRSHLSKCCNQPPSRYLLAVQSSAFERLGWLGQSVPYTTNRARNYLKLFVWISNRKVEYRVNCRSRLHKLWNSSCGNLQARSVVWNYFLISGKQLITARPWTFLFPVKLSGTHSCISQSVIVIFSKLESIRRNIYDADKTWVGIHEQITKRNRRI